MFNTEVNLWKEFTELNWEEWELGKNLCVVLILADVLHVTFVQVKFIAVLEEFFSHLLQMTNGGIKLHNSAKQ